MSKLLGEDAVIGALKRNAQPSHWPKVVTRDSELINDLGLDSLALVAVAFELEKNLGVGAAGFAEAFARVRTVGDLVDLSAAHAVGRAAPTLRAAERC